MILLMNLKHTRLFNKTTQTTNLSWMISITLLLQLLIIHSLKLQLINITLRQSSLTMRVKF